MEHIYVCICKILLMFKRKESTNNILFLAYLNQEIQYQKWVLLYEVRAKYK